MFDADGRFYDYSYYTNAGVIEDTVANRYLQVPASLRIRLKSLFEKQAGVKGVFGLDRILNSP